MKKMFLAILLLLSLTFTSANAVEVTPEEKITGLYVAYFDRAADQAGLQYWTDTAAKVTLEGGDESAVFITLSGGFATHPTFKSTYDHLNNKEFVSLIYRNALGRDGDAEGIAYWTASLDKGMTRPEMVATFVELSLVTDLTKENYPNLSAEELAAAQLRQDLITNKVNASLAFTHQLGVLSNVVDSQYPENDPAYQASIKIISEVTEDAATVSATLDFLDSILYSDDQIRDILEAAGIVNPVPVSITITVPATIENKASKELLATGTYENGTSKDISDLVTWSSSDNSIVSISGNIVTGNSEGDVTITAELNGITQSSQMEVTPYAWWNHLSVKGGSESSVIFNGVVQSGSWKYFLLVNKSKSSSLQVVRIYGTDGHGRLFLDGALSDDLSLGQGVSYKITLQNNVFSPIISYEVKDKDTGIIKTFSITWAGVELPPPANTPPVADAGIDLGTQVSQPITITGSGTDSDGTIISYEWEKGSIVLATTASFDYTPTATGTDILTLTVTDNDGATASDTMSVTVAPPAPNNPPIADAGPDQNVFTYSYVLLDGSASSDADNDTLTYTWSFVSKPEDSMPDFSSYEPTDAYRLFKADVSGTYVLQLIVNDGKVDSVASTVTINAEYLVTHVSNTVELRQALVDAAQNGLDDKIILADGTYKTTDDGEGTFIYLSNEANELTLIGSSSENVILSGDSQYQILNHNSTEDAHLKLEKLSFIDGNSSNSGGGAVFSDFGIEIVDCSFSNNYAGSGGGGGFYSEYGPLLITNTTFSNNTAYNRGGGFYSYYNSSVTVENSTFFNNNALQGGGFYFYSNAILTITNSLFDSNVATSTFDQSGAGFLVLNTPSVAISNSVFKNNNAAGGGGGFFSNDEVEVINSVFKNNIAGKGGGFYSKYSRSKVTNSVFTDNIATTGGGFVANSVLGNNNIFSKNINAVYLTYADNTIINNSIFVDNNVSDINGTDTVIASINHSYIDTNKVYVSNIPSNNIYVGVNLGFADEANGDYHLTAISDLIDAGTTNVDGVIFPDTDLDGNSRVLGDNVDIGPYEYQQ